MQPPGVGDDETPDDVEDDGSDGEHAGHASDDVSYDVELDDRDADPGASDRESSTDETAVSTDDGRMRPGTAGGSGESGPGSDEATEGHGGDTGGIGDDEPPVDPSDDRAGRRRDHDAGTTRGSHPPDPSSETGRPASGPTDVEARTRAGDGREDAESGEWWGFAYDVVSSVLAVVLVGVLLFAVSGVWPPMVAVESPSMTPHMHTGDLVFVMEESRFPGDGAHDTGVVTAASGDTPDVSYRKFGRPGDVIVFNPDGQTRRTPIIHRAMFWVEDGENWYERADRQSVGRYSECGDTPDEALPNCPAPHDGFITKGDANGVYDQVQGLSAPVKPAWVVGTAELRIPILGCIRLRTEGCLPLGTTVTATGTLPVATDATDARRNAGGPSSRITGDAAVPKVAAS